MPGRFGEGALIRLKSYTYALDSVFLYRFSQHLKEL